jgi:hypothetical protein
MLPKIKAILGGMEVKEGEVYLFNMEFQLVHFVPAPIEIQSVRTFRN